jgi:hypothetical protein
MKVNFFLFFLIIHLVVGSRWKNTNTLDIGSRRFHIQSTDGYYWSGYGGYIILKKENPIVWYAEKLENFYQIRSINDERIVTCNFND